MLLMEGGLSCMEIEDILSADKTLPVTSFITN
jgi:hypothetical protein